MMIVVIRRFIDEFEAMLFIRSFFIIIILHIWTCEELYVFYYNTALFLHHQIEFGGQEYDL